MNRSKIKSALLFVIFTFLISLSFFGESRTLDFILVTDALDGFGGRAGSANYLLRVSTGGQPSVVGKMKSANFQYRSGYAHSAWVWHGDANGDGKIDLSDVITLAKYYFGIPGFELRPKEAGDVNCDNKVNLGDAIYLSNYKLKGDSPPCNL